MKAFAHDALDAEVINQIDLWRIAPVAVLFELAGESVAITYP